jgi:hypothetical protein
MLMSTLNTNLIIHPITPTGERTGVIIICPRLLDVPGSLFAAWRGGFFDGRELDLHMDGKQSYCSDCVGGIY